MLGANSERMYLENLSRQSLDMAWENILRWRLNYFCTDHSFALSYHYLSHPKLFIIMDDTSTQLKSSVHVISVHRGNADARYHAQWSVSESGHSFNSSKNEHEVQSNKRTEDYIHSRIEALKAAIKLEL